MKDKLFLLSGEEVERYLPCKEDRIRKMKGKSVWWWLRSPGIYWDFAMSVDRYGAVDWDGNDVDDCDNAVCPALYLNLESLNQLPRDKKVYIRFGNQEWQMLDENTGLLLSKKAICSHKFDDKTNNYEESAIRKFLNEELLQELFSAKQIEAIVEFGK